MTRDERFPIAFLALDVDLGSGQRLHYVLDAVQARQFVLGRASEILLDDPMVSQRHALVCFDPRRGWELLDLRSTNGTSLNGKPLRELTALKLGDAIGMGQSTVRVTHLASDTGLTGAGGGPEVRPPTTVRMRAITPGDQMPAPPLPSSGFLAQVEELRIEIDRVREEREVREIVESDVFRAIRDRAQALRRGNTSGAS